MQSWGVNGREGIRKTGNGRMREAGTNGAMEVGRVASSDTVPIEKEGSPGSVKGWLRTQQFEQSRDFRPVDGNPFVGQSAIWH